MSCNNGLFGGSACSWIVILLILSMCCGDNGIFQNNNGCGCNSCGCNSCGCDNGCGC